MLTDEERKTLVANKVRRSCETWAEANGIIANGYWYAAANRLYYACYYMGRPCFSNKVLAPTPTAAL